MPNVFLYIVYIVLITVHLHSVIVATYISYSVLTLLIRLITIRSVTLVFVDSIPNLYYYAQLCTYSDRESLKLETSMYVKYLR